MWPMKPWSAILVSIVVCMILYALVSRSPYVFGLGITLGIYLADTSTIKTGALYGAIISLPLSLYLISNNIIHGNVTGDAFYSPLNVVLIIVFGTLYGAALVSVKRKIQAGIHFG